MRFSRPDIWITQLHLALNHTHKYLTLNTLCSCYRGSNELNEHPTEVTARKNVCLTGNNTDNSVRAGRRKKLFRFQSNRDKDFSTLRNFQSEYKTRSAPQAKENGG